MRVFDSWASLGWTLVAGVAGYAALVVFLRISGKRTLAKMNAFDLVVTVALGSTLASVLTSNTLPLLNGLVALGLLVVLQYGVAWLAIRSKGFREVLKSTPTLLFYQGEFLSDALQSSRVGRDEVRAAIRGAGMIDLAEVRAVVLETDGSFSVLRQDQAPAGGSSLEGVATPSHPAPGTASGGGNRR